MSTFSLLEPVTRVTPLGVRFWDDLQQAFVADGLVVSVRLATSRKSILAAAGGANVFHAHALPLLAAAEGGAGDDAYWGSVAKRRFVIEVADPVGRFLPFSFEARLPARGLFVWSCASGSGVLPLGLSDGVALFSAASRPVPPMRAVVRAELRDVTTGKPAAGAVLVATVAGSQHVAGIADSQGRVVILFPYPEPEDFPPIGDVSMSPPATPTGSSLTGQTWPVVLGVRYGAAAGPYPPFPELCATLGQPTAQLLGDSAGAPLGTQTLHVGADLVARSTDASTGKAMSVLLVKG